MELYNKYKNKDFCYVTNIINEINKHGKKITEAELKKYFSKTGTFREIIDCICNPDDIYKLFNIQGDNSVEPIDERPIHIRATYPEKAWLYSIIKDPKAKLFLDDDQLNFLEKALEKTNNMPYPLSNNDIYLCKLNGKAPREYTKVQINIFRNIMKAIKETRYVILTNNADDGNCYPNSKLIPYKIEYNNKQDTFSITCYDDKTEEIIRIFFTNIQELTLGEKVQNPGIITRIRKKLEEKRCKNPIIIQINNKSNALQRSAFVFAHYERMIYKENDNIYMNIYYYEEYQQEDILRGILQLGMFVKLIAPDNLVEEIKGIIMKKSEIYK